MNVSRISGKSLLGKILRLPLQLIPKKLAVPVLQGKLKGYRWIVGASIHGCWLGSFEFDKQKLFERTVLSRSVVFDLGAQAGFYTLLASALVGPKGSVFAFEPLPQNIFYLKEHLRLNKISNVTLIEAAVSDKTGIAHFEQGESRLMGHLAEKGELCIKTVALDELILQGKLPVPDLLKIDIEGAEILALAGARDIIARNHPIIFLSTHGAAVHKRCCDLLKSLDYNLHAIDGTNLEHTTEVVAFP